MITKERYEMLIESHKTGANLAPIDFEKIEEYEKANNLSDAIGGRVGAVVSPKTADTKEIDVWRIEAKDNGSACYEHDISIVEDMLKSCDYNDGYIITKHKMDKAKYEALPEFTGF